MDAVADLVRPRARPVRPPAPEPRPAQLGLFPLLRVLKNNPIECWAREHFELPAVTASRALGHVVIINEPAAIHRVLLENAANYRKDALQQRVLSAGLGSGLLSAEDEQWRVQRRTLAPIFSRKTVTSFAPAMLEAANALVTRWHAQDEASRVDVAAEMTRLTLDVLVRTIFSDGLGCDADELRAAMATYFETIGRIDPLDLFGVPDFVPRIGRLRVRSTLRFFDAAIDEIIATRRRRLAREPAAAPDDILTLLLNALDPDTGHAMTETEVRSNILTFIAAGHETTANCLSWSLFLLTQSVEWRDRVAAEADRELDGPIEGARRSAGVDPGRDRGSAAPVSTDRRDQPRGEGPRRAGGRIGQTRDDGGDRTLCAAPSSPLMACARSFRSASFPRRRAGQDRSLCVSAVRRRRPHLHRVRLRLAGGYAGAGDDDAALRVGSGARARGMAAAAGHVAAGRRPADDGHAAA